MVDEVTTTEPCDVADDTDTYVVVVGVASEVSGTLLTELAAAEEPESELEAPVERLTCRFSSLASAWSISLGETVAAEMMANKRKFAKYMFQCVEVDSKDG